MSSEARQVAGKPLLGATKAQQVLGSALVPSTAERAGPCGNSWTVDTRCQSRRKSSGSPIVRSRAHFSSLQTGPQDSGLASRCGVKAAWVVCRAPGCVNSPPIVRPVSYEFRAIAGRASLDSTASSWTALCPCPAEFSFACPCRSATNVCPWWRRGHMTASAASITLLSFEMPTVRGHRPRRSFLQDTSTCSIPCYTTGFYYNLTVYSMQNSKHIMQQ